MILCLVYILLCVTTFVSSESQRCYNKNEDYYPYMGTRTPYHLVGGKLTRPNASCKPLQIWALVRHGTRYLLDIELQPYGLELLNQIRNETVANHKKGAGKLCPKDLARIINWSFKASMSDTNANDLTPLGHQEMTSLGERFKTTFPEILKVHPKNFLFQATNTSRTLKSLSKFQEGILGKDVKYENPGPLTNDPLLDIHNLCPAWQSMKSKSNAKVTNKERDIFTDSPPFLQLRRDISDRLGYKETLEFNKIRPMFEMCRFEAAWFPDEVSTWCTVFTKEDLRKLEYRDDLNYYYCCGPGQDMSPKLGCLTLGDMFEHFQNVINEKKDEPRGIFYFGHTSAIQSLMAILEVSKYPIFDGLSYETADNRTYRNSFNAAFGTNFFSVFYKCNNEYKVQFQMAERVVSMDGCDEEGLCDWEMLKKKYSKSIDSCSTDFCFENQNNEPEVIGYSNKVLEDRTTKEEPKDSNGVGTAEFNSKLTLILITCLFIRFL